MRRRAAEVPAILVTVIMTAMLLLPGAASAHSSQVASTPAADAVLDGPPATVRVEFDSPLLDIGAAIIVRTSNGSVVSTGAPRIDRRSISVGVIPDAPQGEYTVAYRVVSQDGHSIESMFRFRVGEASAASVPTATADPTESSAEPSPPAMAAAPSVEAADEGGHSLLVWLVAGLLLLVITLVGTVLLKR